jgi:rhodanese-related sulfurtransferase
MKQRIVRGLGVTALGLGALAIVAGSPNRRTSTLDVAGLARMVEREDDHVTAIELAQWIRDRKPNLRVIDVRDSVDFDAYHIPIAERIPLDRLVATRFAPNETVVLYSGGGAHAAQGWVFLRALGNSRVYFLRGGVDEWLDEVINPRFPRNATATEHPEIDSISALSRYFGGVPRVVDSLAAGGTNDHQTSGAASWRATVAKVRGRGC